MSSSACSCAGGAAAPGGGDESTGAAAGDWENSRVGRHLSSCVLGPAASSSSLLNEWLLIRTLQLAGELADPLPSPAPVQYAMVLPSLQLLSFIVCQPTQPTVTATTSRPSSQQYDYGAREVLLLVRDCRMNRVWRMRQCYGPQRAAETETQAEMKAAQQQSASSATTAETARHSPAPPTGQTADDRFLAAWQSSRQQQEAADGSKAASVAPAALTTASPATSAAVASTVSAGPSATAAVASTPTVSSSTNSNLRSAIAAARAKAPPFSSALAGSSGRQSTWKAAPQPFGLFDAWGEAQAWLTSQQHSSEHEHYMRCIQEQMATCAQQPLQPPPVALQRPSVKQAAGEVGDGWSDLHALLHHLGFFSSLLPSHAMLSASALFPYPLPPTTFSLPPSLGGTSGPSLLLLHPSAALSDSLEQLDAVSDTQLHRAMILIRRPTQSSEWDMIANRSEEVREEQQQQGQVGDTAAMHDNGVSRGVFSSLLASLSHLSNAQSRQSEQLVWFVPSRLCPLLLSSDAAANPSTPSTDAVRPAIWSQLLSACTVRVVWCVSEADYVSPHRQRQRERQQRRRARQTGDGDATAAAPDMPLSPAHSLPQYHSLDCTPPALPSSSQPQCPVALVYIVVSHQPADGTYRLRVDCDWRLRNKQPGVRQQLQRSHGRSQSHSNAIISANSAGGASHSSRWLPPPLLKSNSLNNAHPPPALLHPVASTASSLTASPSTGTVFKSLFKRLGSRSSARASGQPNEHPSVAGSGRRGASSTAGSGSGSSSAAGSRTSSLSPVRSSAASSLSSSSASLFASRRSPRRGELARHESDGGSSSQPSQPPAQHPPHQQSHHHPTAQQQQQAERRRSERAAALHRHPVLSQPFPPSDCSVAGVDSLAARLSDVALLSACRVSAWREWRSSTRRLRLQVEVGSRHPASRGPSSAASAAVVERSRLLRDMVREHGELVTPAAFFESVFGQAAPTSQ